MFALNFSVPSSTFVTEISPKFCVLIINKFGDEEPKDPLLSDLEDRINTLREEKRGDADEEGGLVVRR